MNSTTKKLSRRGFGRLLAASPLVAAAAPQAQRLSRDEEMHAARERQASTVQSIAKVDLPMSTEPAFTFRP